MEGGSHDGGGSRGAEAELLPGGPGRGFHGFALVTLGVGVLLVWWGAAVTTEDVGLAVPDWPLCYGRINPQGWWKVPALLLEHGHRLIASTVGLLVLAQYIWQWRRHGGPWIEVVGVVLCSTGCLYLVHAQAVGLASIIGMLGMTWVVLSWRTRKWPLVRGLTVLSGLLVVLQASLGGLRVLQMSDPFGIVHGCLGQLFLCLLLLITLVSSQDWQRRAAGSHVRNTRVVLVSNGLFLAVFIQLVLGAILRHTQRDHLAASDVITTGGSWFPGVGQADLFMLFLHKNWGFAVAAMVVMVARAARRWLCHESGGWRALFVWLIAMPAVQVALGVCVIWTGKSFWVTNLHVLNGLGLLAISFALAAGSWIGLGAGSAQRGGHSPVSGADKSLSRI